MAAVKQKPVQAQPLQNMLPNNKSIDKKHLSVKEVTTYDRT